MEELRQEFQEWVEKGLWQGEDSQTKNFAVGNVADWWIDKIKALEARKEGEIRKEREIWTNVVEHKLTTFKEKVREMIAGKIRVRQPYEYESTTGNIENFAHNKILQDLLNDPLLTATITK